MNPSLSLAANAVLDADRIPKLHANLACGGSKRNNGCGPGRLSLGGSQPSPLNRPVEADATENVGALFDFGISCPSQHGRKLAH